MLINALPYLFLALFLGLTSCKDDETNGEEMSSEDCTDLASVFTIALTTEGCNVDIANNLGTTSNYSESVSGGTRTISFNSIPNHLVGTFPNSGNPNTISEQNNTFQMTTSPSLASNVTIAQGWIQGILFSGVTVDIYTAEFFTGSSGMVNMQWNRNTLQNVDDLGLDCNNAHVQPTGKYHYHGIPNAYGDALGVDGTEMVKIGYAADGVPVYYLYYEDDNGNIVEAQASYELKSGSRGGDGITAPNGCYDGEYFQDYEYVADSGNLDACNGRTGPTPDALNGEYYYVITNDFPSGPLCFSGTPNSSFQLGGN
ncbi:hypothetical protein NBRC110019_31700 [Neptunitalea chrysea]|uniref:YHYH domain-containing protein n=2 Tax=Neptunitalea chrysea TaxID=1647581 RepID=A0A9W6B7D1_9FLAO|nr:hypothetical protein NBRC110019_31700 [Neptunitalea chrysea]